MKLLIVVDMQNDFITGTLGSEEAQKIVPNIVNKIKDEYSEEMVIFTKDTHNSDYLETQEGKFLPVKHCIAGTNGYMLNDEIVSAFDSCEKMLMPEKPSIVFKNSFGSLGLADVVSDYEPVLESIELCGLCSDICVVSNALILKAAIPEVPIIVDASCCAGTTPENHLHAIAILKSCQVIVKNEGVVND